MNELYDLALIVAVLLVVTLLNESAIRLLRVKNPNTRFWIYVVSLLASFSVFFFVPLTYQDLVITFETTTVSDKVYTIKPESISFITNYSDFAVFSFVLLLLTPLLFFLLLTLSKKIVERKKNLRPCRSTRVARIVSSLEKEYGVTVHGVSTYDGDSNAFVYGFPPSIAISGRLIRRLKEEELTIVLKHEFCHIKNKDTLLKPFLISLCLFFFYNPAIYFIYKSIMDQREYIADKKAISNIHEKKAFLSLLLKVHGAPVPAGCTFMSRTSKRIEMLFTDEAHRWLPLLFSLILTVSVIFSSGVFFNGESETAFKTPIASYSRKATSYRANLEERILNKERFEFFIPEDISVLKALEPAEEENKRRIVIRDWEFDYTSDTPYQFVIYFDGEGNPYLKVFEKSKRELYIEEHKDSP